MIAVVNYGLGNLGSILNMLKRIEEKAMITSTSEEIKRADKIILPGVGAFDNGMQNIESLGLSDALREKVLIEKKPILGICLGMQLLMENSEEGVRRGLGWIDGKVVKFKFDHQDVSMKIPHMGWNMVQIINESPLSNGFNQEASFYFVHSYHVVCKSEQNVLFSTHYGYDFTSAVQKDNIFGVQFHPEKSHRYGMTLLKNFSDL
jgi:imidazole glycerol-phosphate synthase subunit HisH